MSFLRPLAAFGASTLVAFSLLTSPALADDAADAKVIVKDLLSSAQKDFGDKHLSVDAAAPLLRTYIDRYASVPLSSQDILGRYWAKASPEEQAEFQTVVVDYAIGSWAKQLNNMPSSQTISFSSTETSPEGRLVLHSILQDTETTLVDWQFAHDASGRLVVTDVGQEGAFVVQTMKADFGTIIRSNGGKVSALLDALKAKIASYK